jgi:hypothetical protein
MVPGSWATAPTRCIMPYGRHCPSCNRVGGADGVLTLTRNSSPTQFHTPTQRREGRECVPHDCGAVRMSVCHGYEQGMYRETLLQIPSVGANSPSRWGPRFTPVSVSDPSLGS